MYREDGKLVARFPITTSTHLRGAHKHSHTRSRRPMKHIHQREKRKRTLFAMVKLPTTCLVEKRGNHRRKVFPLFSHERFISFPPHERKRVFPFHRNVVCQYFPSFPPEPSHGDGLFMTLESSLSNEILAFFLDIFRHCGGGKFITTFSLFCRSRCASFRCLGRPRQAGGQQQIRQISIFPAFFSARGT